MPDITLLARQQYQSKFSLDLVNESGSILLQVLIASVIFGIMVIPIYRTSMQLNYTQAKSINMQKALYKAMIISVAGKKAKNHSEINSLASEKKCTVKNDDTVYLVTCTEGNIDLVRGTGSKSFILGESSSNNEENSTLKDTSIDNRLTILEKAWGSGLYTTECSNDWMPYHPVTGQKQYACIRRYPKLAINGYPPVKYH